MRRTEVPIHRPYLGQAELERIAAVLESRWLGSGPVTREFEDRVAALCGARNVVAVSSGTAALQLALHACGLEPGDEVILPSLTFVACSQAIVAAGGRPVYCDVELKTATIDVASAAERIGPRTRAIMPVHFGGFACDLDALLELGRTRGVRVVEDAAHAFGSSFRGSPLGSIGDVTCFSFDPIKNVTCGEGGAVVTADDELAGLVRRARGLGVDRDGWTRRDAHRPWHQEAVSFGLRAHMSDLNAAIGLAQLERLEELRSQRQALLRRYREGLATVEGVVPQQGDVDTVFPFLALVRVLDGRRDALLAHLESEGIRAWVHYLPNHLHQAFADPASSLPATERLFAELLSLPLYHELAEEDVDRIVEAVRAFFDA
ncbi:MAG: DegT/DnrJ/EryC1/StrS family aminotransferase [Gaiella sp.]|nr:DegT/DnrJ/EryC1/StrS family aminotransferase [Gaiella sp.]